MEHSNTSNLEMIGKRIKERRTELGLTQAQLSRLTGFSAGNLCDWENGNKLPSSPALISLSYTLQCSTDWLLTGLESTNISFTEDELSLLREYRSLPDSEQEEIKKIIAFKKAKINE